MRNLKYNNIYKAAIKENDLNNQLSYIVTGGRGGLCRHAHRRRMVRRRIQAVKIIGSLEKSQKICSFVVITKGLANLGMLKDKHNKGRDPEKTDIQFKEEKLTNVNFKEAINKLKTKDGYVFPNNITSVTQERCVNILTAMYNYLFPVTSEPCSICLEVLNNPKQQKSLQCNHTFHTRCIDRWLNKKSNCPCCRKSYF